MKKMKAIFCLCMACMLLFLAACGGGDAGGETTSGRYVETTITPPIAEGSDLLGALVTPEGKLLAFDKGMLNRYESDDSGATWQQSDGPGKANPQLADAEKISLAEDGTILVLTCQYDEATYNAEYGLYKITPDGQVQPFAQKEFDELVEEGKNPYVMQFVALPQGRVLLHYSTSMGYATSVDEDEGTDDGSTPSAEQNAGSMPETSQDGNSTGAPEGDASGAEPGDSQGMVMGMNGEDVQGLFDINTGEKIANISEDYYGAVTYDAQNLYAMNYSGEIEVFSLADGSKGKTLQSKGEEDFNMTTFATGALTVGKDGKLYTLDSKKMRSINPQDDASEVVFNSGAFSIASANSFVVSVAQLQDDSFVVQTMGLDGNALYRYHYDPDAKVDPNKVLRIWALNESSTVRAAISAFMNKHPDGTVEFEPALENGSGQTPEDAIRSLNTSILAGEGPDVIILDGLPIQNFAQKGMLMDLSGKIDTSGMYQQIKAPFETENGTFYLPTRFKVPVLVGDKEDISSITNLQQFTDAVTNGKDAPVSNPENDDYFTELPKEERPVAQFDTLHEAFDLLWASSSPDIVTSDGLNSENLGTMLKHLKLISDKYKLTSGDNMGGGAMMAMGTTSGEATTITGSPIAYSSGRALTAGFVMADSTTAYMLNMDKTDNVYTPFPGLTAGAWQPFVLAGVNASSKQQELAVDFIQLMLSDTVQSTRTVGFPVTPSAAKIQDEEFNKLLQENEYYREAFPDGFHYDVDALVEQLKTPVLTDETLASGFYEVAERYCRGEIELEAAIQQIEQNLNTYLAERE